MAHALPLRLTSLAASAALLALALTAALTMTIVQRQWESLVDPTPIETVVEPPAPPRPRPSPPDTPPPTTAENADLAPTLLPVDAAPPTLTTHVVASEPVSIADPRWIRRPRDLGRYYPRRALERGIEGRVVLDCTVGVRGHLTCDVVSESPANWGFGEAALGISRDHQMVPAMRDGRPVEARYRMVVPFEMQ